MKFGLRELIILTSVIAAAAVAATVIHQGQFAIIKFRVVPPSANVTTCIIDLGDIVAGQTKSAMGSAIVLTNFNNASLTFQVGSTPPGIKTFTIEIYLKTSTGLEEVAVLSPGNTTAHYALATSGEHEFIIKAIVTTEEDVSQTISGQIVVNIIIEKS